MFLVSFSTTIFELLAGDGLLGGGLLLSLRARPRGLALLSRLRPFCLDPLTLAGADRDRDAERGVMERRGV